MQKISIITASYNSEKTIADTLRSVEIQTYPNIEHIVVDGGSTDLTMAIVEREGRRVARALSERDGGIFDAYNKGLRLATGEIIGILNSDDFYASETVIDQVMEAFQDPEVEAVHADLIYVDQNDTSKAVRYWRSRPCSPANLARGFHPAHPTLFLRRAVYDKVGGFSLTYRMTSDVDFMLRAFHVHKVKDVYFPRIWVKMRTGGTTGGSPRSIWRQNKEVRQARQEHGVGGSTLGYFAHKVVDRLLQRVRARSVQQPNGAAV